MVELNHVNKLDLMFSYFNYYCFVTTKKYTVVFKYLFIGLVI